MLARECAIKSECCFVNKCVNSSIMVFYKIICICVKYGKVHTASNVFPNCIGNHNVFLSGEYSPDRKSISCAAVWHQCTTNGHRQSHSSFHLDSCQFIDMLNSISVIY